MWNLKFQCFLWIFSKIGQNSKKWKKTLLDNFILFLKINDSHFLIKPNFCYAVQEKLDGYHGYWWISNKPHNFTKICGHHWIHLVFLIPEMYTFVHFCASLLNQIKSNQIKLYFNIIRYTQLIKTHQKIKQNWYWGHHQKAKKTWSDDALQTK